MCPTRRKARHVAFLHKCLTTQAVAKIVPALRVVTEKAPLCVAYMDVGQGREQDAEALLVAYLEQLKGAPRALIDAFSAHNIGGDERSTSPSNLPLLETFNHIAHMM